MRTIYTHVNDMDVKYTESEIGFSHVEVRVDGQIQETRQANWFMGKLLEKALELEKENYELKKRLKDSI